MTNNANAPILAKRQSWFVMPRKSILDDMKDGLVVKPALATMVIINFIISCNKLLYPLVFATSTDTKTLSIGLIELAVDPSIGAGRPWDLMSALSVGMIDHPGPHPGPVLPAPDCERPDQGSY